MEGFKTLRTFTYQFAYGHIKIKIFLDFQNRTNVLGLSNKGPRVPAVHISTKNKNKMKRVLVFRVLVFRIFSGESGKLRPDT